MCSILSYHDAIHYVENDYNGDELFPRMIYLNHQIWKNEDVARGGLDELVVRSKRNIDLFNQLRNDHIEKIDDYFIEHFNSLKVNNSGIEISETPGSIVDRITIVYLKIYYTMKLLDSTDPKDELFGRLSKRKTILLNQCDYLIRVFNRIIAGIKSGHVQFKIFRQLKMYNDPSLNKAHRDNNV